MSKSGRPDVAYMTSTANEKLAQFLGFRNLGAVIAEGQTIEAVILTIEQQAECLRQFVKDVECYCSDAPGVTCPVHWAEDLVKNYDAAKG